MSVRAAKAGGHHMTEIAQYIDLNLAEKLQDRGYRQKFFLAETFASIAQQLIALRKRRGFDQAELAKMVGTQQPAISRVEKADYQNWSFNTLRKIAGALDARISVVIAPSEDVLGEYEAQSELPLALPFNDDNTVDTLVAQSAALAGQSGAPVFGAGIPTNSIASISTNDPLSLSVGDHRYSIYGFLTTSQLSKPRQITPDKDTIIGELRSEITRLRKSILGRAAHSGRTGGPVVGKSSSWAAPQTSTLPLAVPET